MDLEIKTLSELSQTEKEKYRMISFICGIWKKRCTNELIYKTETDRLREEAYGYRVGMWVEV